jgi:hypothetical protein
MEKVIENRVISVNTQSMRSYFQRIVEDKFS